MLAFLLAATFAFLAGTQLRLLRDCGGWRSINTARRRGASAWRDLERVPYRNAYWASTILTALALALLALGLVLALRP